ncbi:MAG: GTP-binding protein [Methylobacteriaceae bacterium]|nr:GTP-binding protein [Methylobacteriaceae bacterium]
MLLGEIGVGKSSLARRFVFDRFEADYKSTIGVDILTHDVALDDGRTLKLVLWDTDGDFGARIFETVYVKGASGALIVSDATRPPTLVKAARLAENFAEAFPGRPTRVIVNKTDLGEMDASAFAGAGLAPGDVVRASARTGEGVAGLFRSLGVDILRRGF